MIQGLEAMGYIFANILGLACYLRHALALFCVPNIASHARLRRCFVFGASPSRGQ